MRKFGSFLVCGALLFGGVAWVEGQPTAQPKGGFGGFGGAGGTGQNPLSLLNNAQIKKELNITEEQMDKLPAEIVNAIAKVLSEKQYKRFKQIELQQRGNNAFKDEKVQKALGISSEQAKSITSILEDSTKEVTELFKGGKGGFGKGGFGGNTEKLDKIRSEAKEKVYGVLSKDQRKTWREMIGEEFKLERQQFGGFGKKGTDPKKVEPKKDI